MYVYIEWLSAIIVVGIVIDATQVILGKSLKYNKKHSPEYTKY